LVILGTAPNSLGKVVVMNDLSNMRGAARARSLTASRTRRPIARSEASSKFSVYRSANDVGDGILFTGYASRTEVPYPMWDIFGEYTEIVSLGAFKKTLAASPDVPLVLGHDSLRRIASTSNGTLQLVEDGHGLRVSAKLNPADLDVAYIVPKMMTDDDGTGPLISEMSFRFSIVSSQWSPDYSELRITEVDLDRGDVSIVGYGANPYTSATVAVA
jgi:uncharacterized protein